MVGSSLVGLVVCCVWSRSFVVVCLVVVWFVRLLFDICRRRLVVCGGVPFYMLNSYVIVVWVVASYAWQHVFCMWGSVLVCMEVVLYYWQLSCWDVW